MKLALSLVLLVGAGFAMAGCNETCVSTVVHYDGSASGRTLVKMWRETASLPPARALVVFPDVQTALRWNGPKSPGAKETCWDIADPETWTLMAWIDVDARATDDVCLSWDACVPHGSDPRGCTTKLVGHGTSQLEVTISDMSPATPCPGSLP
jgi:hypothetical protein